MVKTKKTKNQKPGKQITLDIEDPASFRHLNLSENTLSGLNMANFVKMTDIQKHSLPLALAGKDILGAAKTGSGKTLAFLIPVLEKLHKENWSDFDGLGALVISPTRELALQIFEVLRIIGKKHSFSAGILIGGKDLKQEQERVGRMNILICTPGRLLQHMDQSPEFNCDSLQILVLDEADRILDIGFEKALNAILENLPKKRQTLLFSATQTKAVRDLARLSVKDPEYISVHEAADNSTPKNLEQTYIVCPLPMKLDILFSFIKSHLKQKILVFMSSCKQVRFVFESFCKMQPGVPLLCLHGKQSQMKRMAIFNQFSRKTAGCLFATDVAARGLDIPAVDWVIQLDCPDDTATYIHRVGRTARYDASGNALLILLPSEKEAMLKELELKKVPIKEIKVNPSKTTSVKGQLAAICSQSPEMKYLAQKAFICYLRSIYLQSNKEVFDVHALPAEEFAEALGLPGAPSIKFKKLGSAKNTSRQLANIDNKEIKAPISLKKKAMELAKRTESDDETEKTKDKKPKTRLDKLFAQTNKTVLSTHYNLLKDAEGDGDEEDSLLTLARKDHEISDDELILNKKTKKKLSKIKRAMDEAGIGKKMHFDEEGNAVDVYKVQSLEDFEKEDVKEKQQKHLETAASLMKEADLLDKETARERLRELKRARKNKEKAIRREESGPVTDVSIGPNDDEGSNEEFENDSNISYNSDANSFHSDAALSYGSDDNISEENILDEGSDFDILDEDIQSAPSVRKRKQHTQSDKIDKKQKLLSNMNTDELQELALKLLQ